MPLTSPLLPNEILISNLTVLSCWFCLFYLTTEKNYNPHPPNLIVAFRGQMKNRIILLINLSNYMGECRLTLDFSKGSL